MIVTASLSSSWRPHLLVAGVAFVIGAVWPTTPAPVSVATEMPAPASPAAGGPSVAFLAVGSSASVWIEPLSVGPTGGLGFRLVSVRPGSAWQRAGLVDGDVVISVGDEPVTLSGLLTAFSGRAVSATVHVLRGERELAATLDLR